MTAATIVLGAWLVFGGSHLLLGLPLRDRLARRLGEQRFVALFSAVAAITLAIVALAVAAFGGEGARGFELGRFPIARAILIGISFVGLTLATAGIANYPRSPMALFRTQVHPPAGIERVTRHAFFVGLTAFATAHALLAPTLAIFVYFAGFAALAGIGAPWQDRKLLAKYGAPYARYVAETSVLPFVALLQRRQRLSAEDRLWFRIAFSGAVAFVLLALHPLWSALNGAPFAGAIAVGGVIASVRRWNAAKEALADDPKRDGGDGDGVASPRPALPSTHVPPA
jgi:uncharacterized membrane protein